MAKTFDFDRFWAEAMPEQADRPKVRVFGEDVFLPVSIPARIILRALRAAEAGEGENATLSVDEVYNAACALYGKERIEAWLDKGLTVGQLGDLVNHAIRLYTGQDDGDDEGNATAPGEGETTEAARSSKSGA